MGAFSLGDETVDLIRGRSGGGGLAKGGGCTNAT